MRQEFVELKDILYNSWITLKNYVPAIIMAFLILGIGVILIKYLRKIAYKKIAITSKDPLVSDFLVNIVSAILSIFLLVACLSILGWGSITNKILAGAGITTFIIGFALKDIGENFLAGIIMAFRRPFKIGDLIQVLDVKGRVRSMSLRETTIKSLDGIDVYMPNALIINNPLQNYTSDSLLRTEFNIAVDFENDIEKVLCIVENTISTFNEVVKTPQPQAVISEITGGYITIKSLFWYQSTDVMAPGGKLRSKVMLAVTKKLKENGIVPM